jgi:hypothetical protein
VDRVGKRSSRTSVSVRLRKFATWATGRPCSSLLLRENRSFLDHSLPLLRGCPLRVQSPTLEPAPSAVEAATEENYHENDDQKCGGAHVVLLAVCFDLIAIRRWLALLKPNKRALGRSRPWNTKTYWVLGRSRCLE